MEPPDTQASQGRAGHGGVIPPVASRFKPGQSGNPGGVPKGFIPLSRALAMLGALPDEDVAEIAEGKRPKRWGRKALPMSVVMAARLWQARDRLSTVVAEIADRTEGKVKQVTETTIHVPDLMSFFGKLEADE